MTKEPAVQQDSENVVAPVGSIRPKATAKVARGIRVSVLTAGRDKPYALGLASALVSQGVMFDFIGSDEVDGPELHACPLIRVLNLRGDQRIDASFGQKIARVIAYYCRLIRYAAGAESKLFHILWNNKFEIFDRTLLMLYYKLLGKKIVFTAHNVNAGQRDSNDSWLNRVSLRVHYQLSDHIFVHTEGMKKELVSGFGVPDRKVGVIPFGINNTVPNTALTTLEAKRRLGLEAGDKTLLFFGNIAPYKGLEYLIAAFKDLKKEKGDYRLLIVGRPKGSEDYCREIQQEIQNAGAAGGIISRVEYVPDEETELYFKAADVLVLPYTNIFQSGVLFLGYSFGLPVIAADVGSLKDEIMEGKTGFVFRPQDSTDLARVINRYFASDLFNNLEAHRSEIKQFANGRYSWDKVAAITTTTYTALLGG